MRLRSLFILILLSCICFTAEAQRKAGSKKPAKSVVKKNAKKTKKEVAKKPVKPVVKAKKITQTPVKDTTTLKGATIEIIQSYKPEVKQAQKPEAIADLPPGDTTTIRMQYNVPPQSLQYTYSALPLRPLALGKDTAKQSFTNYVKLGGGNLATILFDAGIGALKGPNYYTAFRIHHLSQTGSLPNQKSSLSGLDADATFRGDKNIWHTGIGVLYNQFYQFGYDVAAYNYTAEQLKVAYTGLSLSVDMKNADDDKRFSYRPSFSVRSYSDNRTASEYNIGLKLPFSFQTDEALRIDFGAVGMASQFTNTIGSQSNNIFSLTPGLQYSKGNFTVYAGLYPTLGNSTGYLLPDIKALLGIGKTQIKILAGWQGHLKQNRLEQLSTRNSFVNNQYTIAQTHADEIYGGIETNIGNHITVNARAAYWQYGNMPLFINDTLTDNKQFLLVYDKVNAVSLQGSVRYNIAETFALGGSILYTTFDADVNKYAWHEPSLQLKADLMIRPVQQLVITAYLSVLDGIYAIDKGNKTVKLPVALDLGAGAEYSFIPRLSAFAQVNNIFNNQYERWYGYRAYGFNIFGGIRLKF